MCLYHPLYDNYSYNTWLKSTLRSLVHYAQHSESIYFPIYTELFSVSFLQHTLKAVHSFKFFNSFLSFYVMLGLRNVPSVYFWLALLKTIGVNTVNAAPLLFLY